MRLLVVDDDPDFVGMIITSAPRWLRVTACSSSEDAIRTLESPGGCFDVAIIDANMPPHLDTLAAQEGLALVRSIRLQGNALPLILVSGQMVRLPQELVSSVTGFLRKPINLDRVYRFLRAYSDLFGVRAPLQRPTDSSARCE